MRPPVLGVVAVGRRRPFPIPLPVILLWPLVLAGWLLLVLLGAAMPPHSGPGAWLRMAAAATACFWQLGGFGVEMRTGDGITVRVSFM